MTISRYQKRISGPLLDRIDYCRQALHRSATRRVREANQPAAGGSVSVAQAGIREGVEAARERQRQRVRFEGTELMVARGRARPTWGRPRCGSTTRWTRARGEFSRSLVRAAMQQPSMRSKPLSARAFHRILKLASTIADLEGAADIAPQHLAEAIQYQPRKEM